ncbi:MAG: glucoamylase family protein [Planctomycetota bacterium]|nr:glucoamylase family protein [Planctomycetota bacterium]
MLKSIPLFFIAAILSTPARARDDRPDDSFDVVPLQGAAAQRPPFEFSDQDQAFLDEVQRGCFNFLWNTAGNKTGMVYDRTSKPVASVAGVGFQLSALPIGVERGWITRQQGHDRARLILRSLLDNTSNRKAGLYFHYLDPEDAGITHDAYEVTVSTIDSALLFAGAITAASYFKGDVAQAADRMLDEADWTFFVPADEAVEKPYERGYISLGWKPRDKNNPTADGTLLPFYWADAGDEQKLVTFLAVAAPRADHRVSTEMYYRMRRTPGRDEDGPIFMWFPWSGALFTNFFAHCWIDYAGMNPDNPAAQGVPHRPRVDWWENSRRAVQMHRRKAALNPLSLPTLGPDAWGLTACDADSGYLVPGLFPTLVPLPGARPDFDYTTFQPPENYGDGTVAPYGAGCSIIFEPQAALAALRYYRSLNAADGSPLLWRDPAAGGHGFKDSFNLGKMWVAPDCVAIDQGPMILAIENARTGLIWNLFHQHPAVQDAVRRLGLQRAR